MEGDVRKKLLALALSLGGLATVQASTGVTLYGTVDAGVGFKSLKNRVNGDKAEKVGMFGGVWSSNSIGFKGTEDLGNGWSTVFELEKGYDPVRDKPRRSGRGRIARTAQPSLSLGFSVEFAAARCTGARWKSARRRSLKRNRTATTARLSSSASGCRAVPCAAGDWRRL